MNIGSEIIQLAVIAFSAAITQNILLTRFLGMCPFLAVSRQVKTATGLGWAVVFVLTGTCMLNWLVYYFALVPLGLEYLRFILFIVMIAAFVQFIEMTLERYSLALYQKLGIFLPLITVNCAILGGSLFMLIEEMNFIQGIVFGFGSGIGWMIAILAMAGIREKLSAKRIDPALHGPGITLIIVGHMALAFIGFTGVLAG